MAVTSLGFVPNQHDFVLFVSNIQVHARRILLSLYVNNMIIIGDDYDGIECFK